MYHQNKYLACQKLGIRLISIFEPDWRDRKEKIKQYLNDLLLPVQTKIYARKTEVRKIDRKRAANPRGFSPWVRRAIYFLHNR